MLTAWLDPSVIDEADPLSTDPELDMFDEGHGPPYDGDFVACYRAAQEARNHRITAWARAELDRLAAADAWDRLFNLHRVWADLRFLDLAIDPSDRRAGCYAGDPRGANRGPFAIGSTSTLRTWLSMWSLEDSQCRGAAHLARVAVPSLVVQSTADRGVFPSDAHAMPEVMQSVEACAGQVPELVVADAGYDSGETHTLLASKGVEGVVVPQNKDALFWSLDKDGLPVCPMGQSPVAQSGYVRYGRKTVRYRVRGCRSCALNALCKAGTGKSIFVPEGTDPADRIRNAQRLQLPQYQEIAKSRGPTVELVFARIRGKLRGNRFSTRSKRKVQAEFRLFCLSENIRLVLKALFDLLEAFWAAIWPVRRLALGHARLHLQGMLSRTTQ